MVIKEISESPENDRIVAEMFKSHIQASMKRNSLKNICLELGLEYAE